MPCYRAHLGAASIAFIALILLVIQEITHLTIMIQWAFWCLLGGLFPDIDITSRGQRYSYQILSILLVFLLVKCYYALIIALSFLMIIPILTRHRGFFHAPWFVICMPLALWSVLAALFPCHARYFFYNTFFFISGALSHLFLDFKLGPYLRSSWLWRRFLKN